MSQSQPNPHELKHVRATVVHYSDRIGYDSISDDISIEGLGVCRKLLSDTAKCILEANGIRTNLVAISSEDEKNLGVQLNGNSQLVCLTKAIPIEIFVNHKGVNLRYDLNEANDVASEKPLESGIGDIMVKMFKIARKSFEILNNHAANIRHPMELNAINVSFGVTLDGELVVTDILDPMLSEWTIQLSGAKINPMEEVKRYVDLHYLQKLQLLFECCILEFTEFFSQMSYEDIIEMM